MDQKHWIVLKWSALSVYVMRPQLIALQLEIDTTFNKLLQVSINKRPWRNGTLKSQSFPWRLRMLFPGLLIWTQRKKANISSEVFRRLIDTGCSRHCSQSRNLLVRKATAWASMKNHSTLVDFIRAWSMAWEYSWPKIRHTRENSA